MKKFNSLELFAGAGGLAIGLERAGFNNVGVLENNKSACDTLRLNRPKWNVIEQDITQVDDIYKFIPKDIEIDLLSGGYPCQSFSYAGKRLGMADTRGTLFNDFARILSQTKPKMFLVENVKGLVTHDHGNTFKVMINTFQELGYNIKHKVLNANNYGVAEKRERIIIIGLRKDLGSINQFDFPKTHDYKPVLKDVIQNLDNKDVQGYLYSEKKKAVLEQVPMGGNWKDLPEEVAKDYMGKSYYAGGGKTGTAKRLSWYKPAPTLLTSPSQKQTERCHPVETRPLNLKEYALIQSFPSDWKFSGSIASVYKQIGNAVPTKLAQEIGSEIIQTLSKLDKD